MGVTVKELVSSLKRKNARMPFEIGAFVALETAESLLSKDAPTAVSDVRIADDGSIGVRARDGQASPQEAADSVVDILTHLLVAAGHGVPPMFIELIEGGAGQEDWDLPRLRDELEACLIPLNRQASRRVLSRLVRESQREGSVHAAQENEPAPSLASVDADLDAFLGIDAAPDPDPAIHHPAGTIPGGVMAPTEPEEQRGPVQVPIAPRRDESVNEALDKLMETPGFGVPSPAVETSDVARPSDQPTVPHAEAATTETEPQSGAAEVIARAGTGDMGTADTEMAVKLPGEPSIPPSADANTVPPQGFVPRVDAPGLDDDLSRMSEGEPGKSNVFMIALGMLALIGLLIGGVWLVRPDAVARLFGQEVELDLPDDIPEEEVVAPKRPKHGDLVIRAEPERAQVFLYVGKGPAVAEDLPVGVAHEFVVIADGRAPSRGSVPANAKWSEEESAGPESGRAGLSGPRYELAVQASDQPMAFDDLDLGDTRLTPDQMGTASGKLGSVRIITNPPEADVYQLIGFSPTARVQNLKADKDYEVLLFLKGHKPQKVTVKKSDWSDLGGKLAADVEVKLEKR